MGRISGKSARLGGPFRAPDWNAPLDERAVLDGIPEDATIAGMFSKALCEAVAASTGRSLPSARPDYRQFGFHPQRDHVQLLFEAAPQLFPDRSLRQGLRKIGRAAAVALLGSTVGRVVMAGRSEGADLYAAFARTYSINLRGSDAALLESGERYVVLRLSGVHFLLDSHQVGVLEGVLGRTGPVATVRVCVAGRGRADYLIEW